MFPVGTTFAGGELTEPEPEKIRWWDPHEWERLCPLLELRIVEGELSAVSSPEWLLSDFLGIYRLGPADVRPETDPDELELLLVVVAAGPLPIRVRSGDTGEPKSSSRKSGLFTLMPQFSSSLVKVFLNRSESISKPTSDEVFSECDDIFLNRKTFCLSLPVLELRKAETMQGKIKRERCF